MTNRSTSRRRLVIALFLIPITLAATDAASEFTPKPTWEPFASAAVKALLEKHLATTGVDAKRQADARQFWDASEDGASNNLLDRLAGCLAKVDDRVQELLDYCSGVSEPGKLPEFAWLADSETPLLVRHNMRLYFARWLVQQGYYDEALSWTDGLEPGDIVAPDALLFYRAVAHQRLVQPDKAAAELAQLMQREDNIPTRYQKLGDLMRKDLAGLEDESLDHIARRMEDVRRRLAQGRSGEHVQGIENGVIESLDKLIKKAEEQMQKQAQSSAGQAGGQPSGTPMQDSRIAELKAPGRVEQRDIGRGAGWGNLPDKDREKALQDIGREFPSHYREVIEEYFRRLASEDSAGKP